MPFERPLLLFPEPLTTDRSKRHGGPSNIHLPSFDRQRERTEPMYRALADALEKGNLQISNSPGGIDPEYTLVWEIAGDVENFIDAVKKLCQEDSNAAELLFETDKDGIVGDNDFYFKNASNERIDKPLISKYFCIVVNQKVLKGILRLWIQYKKDPNFTFPRNFGRFKNVFDCLYDLHIWGKQERLEETGALDVWEEELLANPTEEVICEVELFYRKNKDIRKRSEENVRRIIKDFGGTILSTSDISEIGYHALLTSIPRGYVQRIVAREPVSLVLADEIMFLRSAGQSIVSSSDESTTISNHPLQKEIVNEPIIALFDGLPQENHPYLKDWLIVDDPDEYETSYNINPEGIQARKHGTSMASLIIHGDLGKLGDPQNGFDTIQRKIYVRPIMKPRKLLEGIAEFIPDSELIVDKIHVAVRRLFEEAEGKVAPSIKIINLSIGIGNRLMFDMVSPLARLLDYLSVKYHILFIVSAGNHSDDLTLPCTFKEFQQKSDHEKDLTLIQCSQNTFRQKKLLSPAESINALTVGATFMDSCGEAFPPTDHLTTVCSDGMPSPISAIGPGKKRSIKPDILFAGGRKFLRDDVQDKTRAAWPPSSSSRAPGILSAAPMDPKTTQNKNVRYQFGTSDATALVSHNAARCYDVLKEVFQSEQQNLPEEFVALLIKAMLVHGARWQQSWVEAFSEALKMPSRNDYADKFHCWFGYGIPDIEKTMQCTKNRITLIGYGYLNKDGACEYQLPLPFEFNSAKIHRSLTVTLANFTPIEPNSQRYRKGNIFFTIKEKDELIPFNNRTDVDWQAVQRGTLQHEHFEEDNIISWNPEDSLTVKVNCREDASNLSELIPYTLFVTLEIAFGENSDIDVYQRVAQRIRPSIRVTNMS